MCDAHSLTRVLYGIRRIILQKDKCPSEYGKPHHRGDQSEYMIKRQKCKYLDLKHSFERLKGDYGRLQQRYASLDASFDRVQEENRELKAVAKDYDTLCRGYGEKEIAARVRAIQEQEAAERMLRRKSHHNRYEMEDRC